MNPDSKKKKCLAKFHLKGFVYPFNNTKYSGHNVTLISLRHILKMKRYIYLLSTLFAFQKNILISVNIQIISCLNAINWRHHPHSRWTQVQFCHLCETGHGALLPKALCRGGSLLMTCWVFSQWRGPNLTLPWFESKRSTFKCIFHV